MSAEPLAYLITFRTYGTWLHGDSRGSTDRDHNVPETPLLAVDRPRQMRERSMLKHGPVLLDAARRTIM